jgi:hypothetical protein
MALAVTPQSAGHTLLAVDCGAFWRLFSVVETPATVALNINFKAWGVAPGAVVTAEEVSAVSDVASHQHAFHDGFADL